MKYEHVCSQPKCYEIVERVAKVGTFTCFKCKAKRKRLYTRLRYPLVKRKKKDILK